LPLAALGLISEALSGFFPAATEENLRERQPAHGWCSRIGAHRSLSESPDRGDRDEANIPYLAVDQLVATKQLVEPRQADAGDARRFFRAHPYPVVRGTSRTHDFRVKPGYFMLG